MGSTRRADEARSSERVDGHPLWVDASGVPPTTKVEAKVPMKAKNIVGPRFARKALTSMLYPASKMIGGRRKIMKNSKSNLSCCSMIFMPPKCAMPAASTPISTPTPASGSQLISLCSRR